MVEPSMTKEPWVTGVDVGNYPQPRTYMVGVNVKSLKLIHDEKIAYLNRCSFDDSRNVCFL